uniref:Uncharacterized protein n=1 Tax=Physcomitrium patens TaxID=3218 RepID=A0A2K1KKE8_PHYPA|nr:hypothetical protein PHYPA_007924 [Physcomitrium patens]
MSCSGNLHVTGCVEEITTYNRSLEVASVQTYNLKYTTQKPYTRKSESNITYAQNEPQGHSYIPKKT